MLKVERLNQPKKITTAMLVKISLLSGIAAVLMIFEFATVLFPSFLKFEFSDIPALIGGMAYGPIAGIMIELIKNLLKLIIKPTTTGGVGELANFLVGVAYLLPVTLLYRTKKTNKRVIIGMALGTLSLAMVAALFNYFVLLPLYANFMPIEAIIEQSAAAIPAIKSTWTLILFGITPFNLVKGIAISIGGYFIFKGLKNIL